MHKITLVNPRRLAERATEMRQLGAKPEAGLYACFARLIVMISEYLDSDPLRTAEVYFSECAHRDSAISWVIMGPPAPHQHRPGVVLAGVMHFHQHDQTWGIHT